jgi:hypothetical protein
MRLGTMNLKHLAGVGLCAAAVLLGGVSAHGQGRHEERKAEHRALKAQQKYERRAFRGQLRDEHRYYGNTSAWRARRQAERTTCRQSQRAERRAFRQRWNPGRHLGRGYYRAPGQRIRYQRTYITTSRPRYMRDRRYLPLRSRYRR